MLIDRITPMVVVPTCSQEWISRCLDSGAQAIIVPHVNNVEQAKICVNASKFPPMVGTVFSSGEQYAGSIDRRNGTDMSRDIAQ